MAEDEGKKLLAEEIQRAIRRIEQHDRARKELEDRLHYWQRVWRNNNYGQYPF